MTPTPCKPDVIALADELDSAIENHLYASVSNKETCAIHLRDVLWDNKVGISKALRHLASQSSLYEAGREGLREAIELLRPFSRDDLVKDLRNLQARLSRANETQADAWDVGQAATRIESDAKRIAELEAERDDIRLHFDQAMKEFDVHNEEIASLKRALVEERERCARLAETFSPIGKLKHRGTCLGIATAIRSGKPEEK